MNLETAITLAIDNILKEGLADTFDRPFEVDLLKNREFYKKVKAHIKVAIEQALGSHDVGKLALHGITYTLLPKYQAFSFRKCAFMHPMDTLKYTAIVLMLAEDIERNRIKIGMKKIYSYRYHPNKGYLFNRNYTLSSFKKQVSRKAQSNRVKFIVSCDISNFYDRLNLHRLENTLLSIGCDEKYVKLINQTLLTMAGKDSYGLPVGSNASRILAEASLIGVDEFLRTSNINFVRFVDDYRLFVKNAETAHYNLTSLIERLDQEGLSVNTLKTKIESADLFFKKNKTVDHEERESTNKDGKDAEVKNPFVIRAGYGGAIPTKFRRPPELVQKALEQIKLEEIIIELQKDALVDPDDVMQAIKACIAQGNYQQLANMVEILPKYLQVSPYYVDAVTKNAQSFSDMQRDAIKAFFSSMLLNKEYLPEYLTVTCITLLSNNYFGDLTSLLSFYGGMKKNQSIWIGRSVLDGIFELVEKYHDRNKMLELRNGYQRSDLWEKRQIIRIVQKTLPEEEARPWMMNILNLENSDLFLAEQVKPSKKTQKKRKKKTTPLP